jgi:5-methyltetrahydrofolate--homocysteine methyltransferase
VTQLNFTAADWQRIERDTMAWWAGELARPLIYLTSTDPLPLPKPFNYQSNYPLPLPADAVVDRYAPFLAATHYYGDAFPMRWINFGPGIMAGFLGGQVHSVSDPSETVWFTPARDIPIGELDVAYDAENIWWRRVQAITAAFVERYGGLLQVGMTDLGGNLDILASLRTTSGLLFDVIERPNEVLRLVRRTTDLWLRYYDDLDALIRPAGRSPAGAGPACRGTSCWTPIWSTGKTYMLQCDFSYMIGPKMFERFVLPDLIACCDHLDHGFYHLDGKGEIPHLDMLLAIPRLRGIQWIPGDGQPTPDQWLPLLKRIRDGGKLCQVFVRPEGARRIVRNLGGKGFLLVIQHEEDEFRDPAMANAFLKMLAREDISLTRAA